MDTTIQNEQQRSLHKNNLLKRISHKLLRKNITTTSIKNREEAEDILNEIKFSKNEWISANEIFEYTSEQELIDYCTYNIKACQVRYEYFLRKAKEKGIRLNCM